MFLSTLYYQIQLQIIFFISNCNVFRMFFYIMNFLKNKQIFAGSLSYSINLLRNYFSYIGLLTGIDSTMILGLNFSYIFMLLLLYNPFFIFLFIIYFIALFIQGEFYLFLYIKDI